MRCRKRPRRLTGVPRASFLSTAIAIIGVVYK